MKDRQNKKTMIVLKFRFFSEFYWLVNLPPQLKNGTQSSQELISFLFRCHNSVYLNFMLQFITFGIQAGYCGLRESKCSSITKLENRLGTGKRCLKKVYNFLQSFLFSAMSQLDECFRSMLSAL